MRPVKVVFWPVAAVDAIVLVATPIQGGHHLVDVIAGSGVAVLAIAAAKWASSVASAAKIVAPLLVTGRTTEG
jgi:membrane-associated phospholipid phosphatase